MKHIYVMAHRPKAPAWTFRYRVVGSGEFPMDMMRYDHSYPVDSISAATILNSDEERVVELETRALDRTWEPTRDRWQSFGWDILPPSPYPGWGDV